MTVAVQNGLAMRKVGVLLSTAEHIRHGFRVYVQVVLSNPSQRVLKVMRRAGIIQLLGMLRASHSILFTGDVAFII